MKSDLDNLMDGRGFDALVVTGPANNNPVMYYLANGAKVGEGTMLVKKRGTAPTLLVNLMERDEAAKSGLQVIDWNKYERRKIVNEEHGDLLKAGVRIYESVFADLGVHGSVAIYGREEQGHTLALAQEFNSRGNGTRLVGEYADTIFEDAW